MFSVSDRRAMTPTPLRSASRSSSSSRSSVRERSQQGLHRSVASVAALTPAPSPWHTAWRPAPAHLVDEYRSLTMKGQAAIGRALIELGKAESNIQLSDSDFGEAGGRLLAAALRRHCVPGLRNLNLGCNRLGDGAVIEIADALELHKGLQVLNLSWNQVGDAGGIRLAELVERHPSIRLLGLDGNQVGDSAAARLVLALAVRRGSTQVSCTLSGNPTKQFDGKARENLSLPACTVKTLSERAITYGQLLQLYALGCAQGKIKPTLTTTREVVFTLLLPGTRATGQSWVEVYGKSVLPVATTPPSTKVIHSWDALFYELVRAVASHATGMKDPPLDPDDLLYQMKGKVSFPKTYFIDIFSVNQHISVNELRCYGLYGDTAFVGGEPGCQVDKLDLVSDCICRRDGNIMIVVDAKNLVLSRINCLLEVHYVIRRGLPVVVKCSRPGQVPEPIELMLSVAASERERQCRLEEINESLAGGISEFDRTLASFFMAWNADQHEAVIAEIMRETEKVNNPYKRPISPQIDATGDVVMGEA